MNRRSILAWAGWCGAALLGPATALAQPAERPPRILVGFAPGGTTDIVARVLAEATAAPLGHRALVENRTGANGFIAAEAVARGPADGSQVLVCPMGLMTISPEMPGLQMPLDVGRDLVPIANIARSSYAVVTGAASPYRTLEELLAAARARPGALTYASAGYGQAQHLSGERLKRLAGVDLVHVPYRGAAPAAIDVIAGRADLLITNLGDVIRQIQGGQLRLLALADRAGWPEFPDAPRLPDIVPGLEVSGWFGLCGPRGLPEAAIARWTAAVRAALQDETLRRRLLESGLAPLFEDHAAFATTIGRDRAAWGEVIRAAGIRAE
ncbi:MAG: tripartite tricarboxylate transporter substrate binding protein [Roseococcus sp.]|nr:tripartite tricarboxylate transporter substrate binding protein [Roseococcus sp.]